MSVRITAQDALFETNEIFYTEDPDVTINIGVFGDSIGKGVILKADSNRYEMIKIDLNALLGRNNFCVNNYSLFGCTISKGLLVIKRHASKLSKYDHIFLELGGNDCDFSWEDIAKDPYSDHTPKTPPDEFDKIYTRVINEIRDNKSKPVILTLPPLDPSKYFSWISRSLDPDNILKWLGSVDMIYRWQEMYNIRILMLASALSVPVIDIRSPFLKQINYSNLLCKDGIHPNSAGYELIYRTIAEKYLNICAL